MAENAVTMKWMMVSRIVIIWFWVIIINMTLTFFQAWKSKKQVSMAARSRLGSAVDLAAIFFGYSLRAGLGMSSSIRAQERPQPWLHTRRVQRGQLREAVGQTRHLHQGWASFHVYIWLLHIVRTIIYKQARTNLMIINYVWYQTFSIKFFISTL